VKGDQVKGEGRREKGNTQILINGEACSGVDALDRGLHYGDGVFRTLKVVAGRVRWWEDQFCKLAEDCAAFSIACPDKQVLEREVRQLAAEPGVGVIKIIVTRGAGQRGYGMPSDAAPTRIVMGFPFPGRENLDVRVRWCELRLASQPRLAGIKHLNRLENVLARSEWRDPGIAEGLLMDEAGLVICGTMTNLFIVEQGRLITPDLLNCGIAGVTRSRIMRAAERHGQTVAVEPISSERLLSADEVLLCNSLVDVWRVAEMDDRRWPDSGWAEKLRSWLDEEDN
jgi:4-amino-4-deoxychorismate lyase